MKALLLTFWLAQGADMTTTLTGLHRGCDELNPLYRTSSPSQMIALKGISTLTITVFAVGADRTGRPKLARGMLVAGILAGGGAAVWNLHQIGRC